MGTWPLYRLYRRFCCFVLRTYIHEIQGKEGKEIYISFQTPSLSNIYLRPFSLYQASSSTPAIHLSSPFPPMSPLFSPHHSVTPPRSLYVHVSTSVITFYLCVQPSPNTFNTATTIATTVTHHLHTKDQDHFPPLR